MKNKKVIIMLVGSTAVAIGGCVISKYIEKADEDTVETAQKILKTVVTVAEAVGEFLEANRYD